MSVMTEDLPFRPMRAENRLFHLWTFNTSFKNILLVILVVLHTDISTIDFENRTAKKLQMDCQKHKFDPFPINQPSSLQQEKTEGIYITQNCEIKSMHNVDRYELWNETEVTEQIWTFGMAWALCVNLFYMKNSSSKEE